MLLAPLGVAAATAFRSELVEAQEFPPPPEATAAFLDEPENIYRLEVHFWAFGSLATDVLVRNGDLAPRNAARELRQPPEAVGLLVDRMAESVGTKEAEAAQELLRSGRIDAAGSLRAAVAHVREVLDEVAPDAAQPVFGAMLESPIHLERLSRAGAEVGIVRALSVCEIWVIRLICSLVR